MSHDDIDTVVLKLHDFLIGALGCPLDDDGDYEDLYIFMHDMLNKFVTRERNYN